MIIPLYLGISTQAFIYDMRKGMPVVNYRVKAGSQDQTNKPNEMAPEERGGCYVLKCLKNCHDLALENSVPAVIF